MLPPHLNLGLQEICCFDKLTVEKDLRIAALFVQAYITDQLYDSTQSHPSHMESHFLSSLQTNHL